jgi:hypothetical protein
LSYSTRRRRPELEEVDIKYTKRYYGNSSVSVVCIADATRVSKKAVDILEVNILVYVVAYNARRKAC